MADVAKKAMAAFAAAAVALTPLAAGATEGSIMPSRNREEDKAARSFMDSQGGCSCIPACHNADFLFVTAGCCVIR